MKKKLLSLALALALCLGLAAPASAAGAKKVVEVEENGLKITMNGFLREETRRYDSDSGTVLLTIYVVEDNSTVTVEAMEGRKYATEAEIEAHFGTDWTKEELKEYAYCGSNAYRWASEIKCFSGIGFGGNELLTGPVTMTESPSDDDNISVSYFYAIGCMCESDYAKLVPTDKKPLASDWAQAEVEKAWDADLMPFSPYVVDCARGMTRAEFAAVTVYLYAAMIGEDYWDLDADAEHPFTDVDWETTDYVDEIGMAYNLGFVKGANAAGTLFNPNGTLSRQEAAVMLARVYAKLYGDIPAVANTTFADDKDVKSWAKSGVAFMSDKGIVKGVGDNKFAPTKTLAIQEAVIMANRMLEKLK